MHRGRRTDCRCRGIVSTALVAVLATACARNGGSTHAVASSSAGSVVSGRVVRRDGGALPPALRVVALPGADFPSTGRRSEPAALRERIDAVVSGDGAFRLDASTALDQAELTAVAPGWIAARRMRVLGARAEIELAPLFAVAVELVDGDGSPIETNARLHAVKGAFEALCQDRGVHDANERIEELELAGCVDVSRTARERNWLFFRGTDERESVGPIELSVDVAGYAPKRTHVRAQRWTGGVPQSARVELAQRASGFGTIDLELTGLPEIGFDADGGGHALAGLRLVDAAGKRYQLALSEFRAGTFRFDGIPMGDYYVGLTVADVFHFPTADEPLLVSVGNEPASLRVDCSDAGALWVQLDDGCGGEYSGRATLRVHRIVGGGYRHITFERGPYVLPAMAPGEYDIGMLGNEDAIPGNEPFGARGTIERGKLLAMTLLPAR